MTAGDRGLERAIGLLKVRGESCGASVSGADLPRRNGEEEEVNECCLYHVTSVVLIWFHFSAFHSSILFHSPLAAFLIRQIIPRWRPTTQLFLLL